MKYSLGIDAAWTLKQPSGVCLLRSENGNQCELLRLGKSYNEFVSGKIDWDLKFPIP